MPEGIVGGAPKNLIFHCFGNFHSDGIFFRNSSSNRSFSMPDTYDGPFSLLRMFWGNLAARPLRCGLSILAIAIQVVLVLMIVGLTSGIVAEWGKRVEGVGADLLVQPPNSS